MPRHILLLEDDAIIGLDMETSLVERGYDVTLQATQKAAIAVLETDVIDLAILDFHLREGDSVEVAALARVLGIPFIVCSGSPGSVDHASLFEGATILTKPYSPDELLELVASLESSRH